MTLKNSAMLELQQILRANEINFAVLAALPAFFLSYIVFMVMRAWLKQVGYFITFCQYTSLSGFSVTAFRVLC